MAVHPTKALGIPYVGNKWAHMEMFSAALPPMGTFLGGRHKYLDLTFGCGICSVFMHELGTRDFICNDASPYPRLIAEALLGRNSRRLVDEEILERVMNTGYRPGWVAENVTTKAIRHRTACVIDAMCEANQDCPMILVAIGAVLSNGAMSDFRYGTTKNYTVDYFRKEVAKKARRLGMRIVRGRPTRAKITAENYLNISKRMANIKGYVCYLDPAWPAQPEAGRKHAGNDRVYGFYAQKLMSVLRQADQPMPEEYSVTLDECYTGMRRTIDLLRPKNSVLIAYQSRPDVVEEVKEELLAGLEFEEFKEQRTSGTKLWEYLWRIK